MASACTPDSGADVCCSNCSTNFKDEITRALTEASICSTPAAKLFAIDHNKRIMTTDDKTSLTKTLEEERQAMIEGTLNVAIAPCPLTNGLIRAIVDNSQYLFSISDVKKDSISQKNSCSSSTNPVRGDGGYRRKHGDGLISKRREVELP